MKKTIAILILGAVSSLALAGGDHAGSHSDVHSGHAMEAKGHAHKGGMKGHAHEDTNAAAGQPGDPAQVSRTITVTMNDTMRFDPAEMKFRKGETVRFVVRNDGKIRHEMVIGSVEELKEHAEMMRKMPDMQHEEPNMISLAPGKNGDLIWQFDKDGAFDFACLVPGHLEAGMTGKIDVR